MPTRLAPLLLLVTSCFVCDNPVPPDTALVVLGSHVLTDVANATLQIDPTQRDPMTALAECADLVSSCYVPGGADLAFCLDLAHTCDSDQPWNEKKACCPKACKEAFTNEVSGGLSQRDALEKTFFLAPDCFPGVRALLEAP
jgi:hypothetical protein